MDRITNPFVCDHGSVIEEMRQQQVLVTQLRALVLPSLRTDGRFELVAQLFEELLSCSASVISRLESGIGGESIEFVDDKSRVRKNLDERMERLEEEARPNYGHKRRRNEQLSRSLITDVPDYDGFQWRKYGKKPINSAKYPRSYYRCTYSKEKCCPATKTTQQQENNGVGGGDDTAKYTVVYYGHHTCKGENTFQLPHVVETDPHNSESLMNLFMLPEMSELPDSDVPALLQAIADVPLLDSDNWEMGPWIGSDPASSPTFVGGFNF